MGTAETHTNTRPRREGTTLAAFVLGLPLAGLILGLVYYGPLGDTVAGRYLKHSVEAVELILFCVALGALAAKVATYVRARALSRLPLLPPWDGRPVPVSEAGRILGLMGQLPARVRETTRGRRVAALLDHVARRGSAADLDDQIRELADADRDHWDGSYALVRFITWAIPILGFLGTVLGITGAISGVTPERLEQDLNSVTDGLALAFDSTALALGLTMVAMFFTYLVERLEESVLLSVDDLVAHQLAHRFERSDEETSAVLTLVRENSRVLVETTQELVRKQAEIWALALAEVDQRRQEFETRMQERLSAALEQALTRALEGHSRTTALQEETASQRIETLLRHTEEAVNALSRTAEGVHAQAELLARLHDDEAQLMRLQEALARNFDAVTVSGRFEEAVHSLSAAAHLLTARMTPGQRPGVAA